MKIKIALVMTFLLVWLTSGWVKISAFDFWQSVGDSTEQEMMQISPGADVLIMSPVQDHIYVIFNPDDVKNSGMYCAYIQAEDLLIDNNLTHYGTCLINDLGEFSLVELSEDKPASYQDMKNSPAFVSERFFRVVDFDQIELIATPSPTMSVTPSLTPTVLSPTPELDSDLTATPTVTIDQDITPSLTPEPTGKVTSEPTPTVEQEVVSALEPELVPTDVISPEPTTHVSITPTP